MQIINKEKRIAIELFAFSLDEVESLSLQGTYSDKIMSVGDAFLNFKRLRSLDLSRNSIVNLGVSLQCFLNK